MKMVAAAKLRRAQSAVVSARPYSRKLSQLIEHLAARTDLDENPLMSTKDVRKVAIIVVTADRGFCGAFNSNVIRATREHIGSIFDDTEAASNNVALFTVGKKGHDFFSKRRYEIAGDYSGIFHSLDFSAARQLTSEVVKGFVGGEYGRVDIIYNEFKNIIQQRLVVEPLLPVPKEALSNRKKPSEINYIYEPDSKTILDALMPRHLEFQIWRSLLESNAAGEGARMAAMDNASENASELISSLSLEYNKARQAAITKELLEVVSGAEALKAAG